MSATTWTDKSYIVTMPDGSEWAINVMVIAEARASYYAAEFDDSLQQSLDEDTLPLFASDEFEIRDWAQNNMNWCDVEQKAVRVTLPKPLDPDACQEAWVNGEYRIEEIEH